MNSFVKPKSPLDCLFSPYRYPDPLKGCSRVQNSYLCSLGDKLSRNKSGKVGHSTDATALLFPAMETLREGQQADYSSPDEPGIALWLDHLNEGFRSSLQHSTESPALPPAKEHPSPCLLSPSTPLKPIFCQAAQSHWGCDTEQTLAKEGNTPGCRVGRPTLPWHRPPSPGCGQQDSWWECLENPQLLFISYFPTGL